MENSMVTLTEKEIVASVNKIKKAAEKIDKGYMSIINELGALRMSDAHKAEIYEGKYRSFAAFCNDQFGLSKSTLYNLLRIFDEYSVNGKVPDEIAAKGTRPLLAELSAKENEEEETLMPESTSTEEADSDLEVSTEEDSEEVNTTILEFAGRPEFEAWLEVSRGKFFDTHGKIKAISLVLKTVE